MKFADNSNQAAGYLRQAVPLMVKYQIPPNPLNYALWYTYVSKRMPALNLQMDKTVQTYGTCPNLLSEKMFREHMLGAETDAANKVQGQLVAVINNLHTHAHQAAKENADFSEVLESSLDALQAQGKSEQNPPLESVIQTLSQYTLSMNQSTQEFQRKIEAAQKEINTLREELERTRLDASMDALTGLYNRRTFDQELEQLSRISVPNGLSLLMLDVDHFKKFNDTYGHQMGDKVLQHVGKLLQANCPEPMIPVRYGGEEFAVILPECSAHKAAAVAEMLRSKVQAIRIKQKNNGNVISSISASFGVAQLVAGETPSTLINRADQALYAAKQNGRNQVHLAD
ncbi:GGDEF domain-containing protein [Neptuniibacter sp. CAU 1671]|uniref:GGDEF domain-containing protein n=1 Tax=Neptuniibacter sp. CAU 1671 TaxID=3032593 RepID=UPI0023DA42AC|nr:GGDEF domain-containing protein [Neptuniibacter sp. CAU 1671]MDF2182877.1 GGDEF domain-containing protein [Neptuniibacter sp. CAU 1671]